MNKPTSGVVVLVPENVFRCADENGREARKEVRLGQTKKPKFNKEQSIMHTKQGRITFYIPARHYGFIQTPDGQDFFFHDSNFSGTPVLSTNVEFETALPVREGQRLQAVNVTLIEKPAATPAATPNVEVSR